MDDPGIQSLRRSPFSGVGDISSVFSQLDSIASVPMSATEDIGIAPEILSLIRNGLYNADFRTPPPDPTLELDDITNKLPGWSYVKTGTSVTVKWVDDTAGGNVTFSVAAGVATGNQAYIEQIIPISQIGSLRLVKVTTAKLSDGAGLNERWCETQFLDADGVATGASHTEYSTTTVYDGRIVSTANGETGAPVDAFGLRVRVGVTDNRTTADTFVFQHVFVEDRIGPTGGVAEAQFTASGDIDLSDTAVINPTFPQMLFIHDLNGANRTVRGIISTGMPNGRIFWLYNGDSTYNLVLSHEDLAAGAASYRIRCPNSANLTIRPFGGVQLVYFGKSDDTVRRWRVMSEV